MKTDSVKTKAQSIEKQSSEFETRIAMSASGIAHKYADPSKIPLEDTAWADAVAEKYAHLIQKKAEQTPAFMDTQRISANGSETACPS